MEGDNTLGYLGEDWAEHELNPRPAPLAVDRCAVYTTIFGLHVRCLSAYHVHRSRIAALRPLLELTNVATLALHPAVAQDLAKRLLREVANYERLTGTAVESIEVMAARANALIEQTEQEREARRERRSLEARVTAMRERLAKARAEVDGLEAEWSRLRAEQDRLAGGGADKVVNEASDGEQRG